MSNKLKTTNKTANAIMALPAVGSRGSVSEIDINNHMDCLCSQCLICARAVLYIVHMSFISYNYTIIVTTVT